MPVPSLPNLRKINAPISDDYINNNHLVSTLSDAAQHLAGEMLFCYLDCSQAYHCLQMTDQRSVELHAFTFVSRTIAFRRLAQGLSMALSAFSSSFIREYLDTVIKAISGRYWDSHQYNEATHQRHQCSFQMYAQSWPETDN